MDIIKLAFSPGLVLFRISGNLLQENYPEILAKIESLIETGSNRIICNLADIEDVSPEGMKAFLDGADQARAAGGKLCLCNLDPKACQIACVMNFNEKLDVFRSEPDAIADLDPDTDLDRDTVVIDKKRYPVGYVSPAKTEIITRKQNDPECSSDPDNDVDERCLP